MPLKDVFKAISEMFEHEKADYAVIGAFALYAYGYVRATKDIDFVTRIEFQKKAVRYLESLGFKTTYCSEAFSNHVHPIGTMHIDVMYLEKDTADTIFRKTERRVLFEDVKIPVVSAEHLVAMKLFAAKHNERRRLKDLADIKEIIATVDIDKKIVQDYFKHFGLESYYNKIEGNEDESRQPSI
ncbi:MAG: nucleotidyl transferase AbiEii/AbiGii toxin family protein [Chitinispirillaceae bacterium]|nr:nucleotidyl transferase AbiEii/AbiGii toxin family protein [Chitinispirillaceae bacterium]